MAADMVKLLSRLPGRKYQRPEYTDDNPQGKTTLSETGATPREQDDWTDPRVIGPSKSGWNPLILTKIALLSFAAVFLACLVTLMLLWHFSNENDGLDLLTSNQYTWTYGPTAVLIVLTSLWRQIDYHCKVLKPWEELQKGSARANKSILLDYSSTFQVVALVRAIWDGHVVIVLTILGFVTLKVITIASTGLFFVATTRTSPQSVELARVTKLNASQHNASVTFALGDTSLVYTAYALMQKGLPLVEGTKANMVYETFSLPNVTKFPNVTFNANVQGFFPKYNCSPISINPVMEPPSLDLWEHVEWNPSQSWGHVKWNATVNTTTCKDNLYHLFFSLKPETIFCPPRQLKPALNYINCLNASQDADIDTYQTMGLQHILSMADFRFTQVFNASTVTSNLTYGDVVWTDSWNIEIKEVSSVICYPYYTIQTVGVTYDMSETPPAISIAEPMAGSETQFETFSNRNLLEDFGSSLNTTISFFGDALALDYALEVPDTMFNMMAEAIGGSYEELLDEKVLADAAELVFEHVAVQIAKKYLTQADQSTYQGEAIFAEERCQVRTLSLAIMTTGFGLMAVMVVAVLFTRPFEVAPCNPESIASIAGATAHSEGFEKRLYTCARSTEDDAARFLKQGQYSSFVHSDFGSSHVEIHDHHNTPDKSGDLAARLAWWDPLTLRKACILLSLLTPLLVIATLEVLQRISDNNNNSGFTFLPNVSSTVTGICTRFLPALIMLSVATLFNCLDFNSSCLAPFNSLRSWENRGYETMTQPFLGQYPPLALWTAFRLHYWTAALTAAAAFVGSVLTIIVSGLLTVENIPYESAVSLKQLDTWNTTWRGSSLDDRGAAVLLSLIESANLSYPAFTFGELAFPKLGQAKFVSDGNNQPPGLVHVQVPALRGKLDCTSLAREHYNITASWNSEAGYYNTSLAAVAPLPSHCLLGGPYSNETTSEFGMLHPMGGARNATYVAFIEDLHVGPYNDIMGPISPQSKAQQPDNPPGCPSLTFWFGYVDAENMENSRTTVLVCDQQLEQVTTNVTLTYPEYSISPDHPLMPDESTAMLLRSGPNNETAFWWRLGTHMTWRFSLFNQSKLMTTADRFAAESMIMSFFEGVLEGETPMPLDTLLDSAATFTGIQRFYRRYMAQAISSNMRKNSTIASMSPPKAKQTADDLPSFTATYAPAVGTARLVQHKTPKLVLQIMLAVMFICGTLAWVLGDFHKVVPWNPCTIAGIAVLFAGSRMCDPQIQMQRKPRQFLDQNMQGKTAQAHEHSYESSVGTTSERVSLPSSNDSHRNNDEVESTSISTSVGPWSSVSNRSESQVHLMSGRGSVISQNQNQNYSCTSNIEDLWPGMRFRLGWWRDGSFMGRHGPPLSSSSGSANVKATGRTTERETLSLMMRSREGGRERGGGMALMSFHSVTKEEMCRVNEI